MPRVIKHPEIRRTEILDIAENLFAVAGYSSTSVDSIILKAGLSKGAFYHHFASKETLLEALAARVATSARKHLQVVLADPGLNAVQRLNAFLGAGRHPESGPPTAYIFAPIFKPENLMLYHRLHTAVSAVMTEPLAQIIEAGVREGTMRCYDTRTTAEIVLALGTTTHGAVADLIAATTQEGREHAMARFQHRMEQQGIAVDRILGLPDGTTIYWDAEIAARTMTALGLAPTST